MSSSGQQIFLIRHGETEWSLTGQHTGHTDIALTKRGKTQAEALGRFLKGRKLAVWSSPLQRARETCVLAGFHGPVDDDLIEWNYGSYEGRTTAEIRREVPSWSVWDSPIAGGESLEQVAARARNVIDRVTSATDGDVGLFAHGHILRILAACWLGLSPGSGRLFALNTGTISVLGHERETRVIRLWNAVPGGDL